jgi:hypothetical protein
LPVGRLDRHLNLVVPCDTSIGEVEVHSVPVSYAVFEKYYRVMARAWTMVASMGPTTAGPKVAMLELRETARSMGMWDGPDGTELGLVAEMRRLTNVIRPTERGLEPVPLEVAIGDGTLDPEDAADVEGIVAFFTLASAMLARRALATTLGFLELAFGARTTSSTCSEWIVSSRTSTEGSTTQGSQQSTSGTGAQRTDTAGTSPAPEQSRPSLAY